MKKMLALALAMTMTLGLTACSGGSGSASGNPTSASGGSGDSSKTVSELQKVKDKGTLVVGITNFEPMDYKDENGNWIGFDADMANAFAESLGVEAKFVEITWSYKVMELDAGNVDCLWNGMTLNEEVMSSMSTSNPYCTNAQVLIVPKDKAADFEGLTSLEGLNVAVESGSAGEDAAEALGATTIPLTQQSDTLFEVNSGTADAAVIDMLMAAAMVGEGTSYADLTYVQDLNEIQGIPSEEYGVGFRKESDLTEAFNKFWAEKVEDGTVLETATAYGLQDAVILQ